MEEDAEAGFLLRDDGSETDDEVHGFPTSIPVELPLTEALPVYLTIHRVRRLVVASIVDPYTSEQLRTPRMNARLVRPLVEKLYNPSDLSIVYCVLVNRVQFLREQSQLHSQTVNIARANLCELLATRLLRRFHEDNSDPAGLLLLANILVLGFDPFQGAPDDVQRYGRRVQWPIQKRGGHERKLTALELAILSESKVLISSSACERVVTAIYEGIVTYTPLSFVDILPDHYEHAPVTLYNPNTAPLLNHLRLIVPRSRNAIELFHFVILLGLYVATMMNRGNENRHIYEAVFNCFAAGWVLEQFAAIIEHGWEVHSQNLWSFLDVTFILILIIYAGARVVDLGTGPQVETYALHVLCTAAPVLLTRLAFTVMPDNIVFISLHVLMKDFLRLTFISFWCFTGFLVALEWLLEAGTTPTSIEGADPTEILEVDSSLSWALVCKWLLWIWFGLDGTGIERSVDFHIILGPTLMIAFAFLGNTLFLTILVAVLTNTFSKIVADEAAEIQFRHTVLTFQGVKSDAIFLYPPSCNILALGVLLPLKLFVSPRTFHRVNVALVCTLNAPVLLLISLYERRRLWHRSSKSSFLNWNFTGFSPHGNVEGVFKADPPPEIQARLEDLDALSDLDSGDHESPVRAPSATTRLGSMRRRKPRR